MSLIGYFTSILKTYITCKLQNYCFLYQIKSIITAFSKTVRETRLIFIKRDCLPYTAYLLSMQAFFGEQSPQLNGQFFLINLR